MNTFSLAIESVGASDRTLFGILIEVPFSVGGLVACWLSEVSVLPTRIIINVKQLFYVLASIFILALK